MLFRQLSYFIKVAEYQNVSRASEILAVSQPTLSRTIQQLEEELGTQLFLRKGKSLILTDSGRYLLDRSHEIMLMLKQTRTELEQLKEDRRSSLTVQLRCIAGIFFDLLPGYIREHQDMVFTILQNDNEGISSNNYDLFLYPSASPVSTASAMTLFKERIYIAVSKKDPLSEKAFLQPEDLFSRPYVAVAGNRFFHQILEDVYPEDVLSERCSLYCDGVVAARNLVRDNGYIAYVPQYTWKPQDLEGVVLKELYGHELFRYICLGVNMGHPLTAAAAGFRDYLLRQFIRLELIDVMPARP